MCTEQQNCDFMLYVKHFVYKRFTKCVIDCSRAPYVIHSTSELSLSLPLSLSLSLSPSLSIPLSLPLSLPPSLSLSRSLPPSLSPSLPLSLSLAGSTVHGCRQVLSQVSGLWHRSQRTDRGTATRLGNRTHQLWRSVKHSTTACFRFSFSATLSSLLCYK